MKKLSNILTLTLLFLGALTVSTQAASLTLAWDPSPSPDAIGYKVHYTLGDGGDFDGTGINQGGSPIDVGSQMSVDLDGLANETVYTFTVTSYDSTGAESPFSNVVTLTTATADENNPDLFIPALVYPAHQAADLPTAVTFDWSDPGDNRAVHYTLVFGTDPALAGDTVAASALPGQTSGLPLSATPSLALAGLLGLAIPCRRKFKGLLAVLLLAGGLMLSACGSGGSDVAVTPDDGATTGYTSEIDSIVASSFEIYDFEPGTTYYWKVTADDGINVTESEIHSFTTAQM